MTPPTRGAWQTDPQVQAFIQALQAEGIRRTPQSKGDMASPTMQAFNRYITQNRARLGIPEGYGPSIASGGQTLDDWSVHPYKQAAILGAAAAGPFVAPLVAGSSVPELGNVNSTIDALQGGARTGLAALATPAGLLKAGLSGVPAAVSAVRAFGGGGGGPFGDDTSAGLVNEIRDSIAAQRKRFDETQPAFETSQRMALGMAPTRYRSGPFGGG